MAPPQQPSRTIPAFFTLWFTTLDPLLSLLGVLGNLFNPTAILTSYTPTPTLPPAPETILLLDTVAGFLLCLMVLQIVLLRMRPDDLAVWYLLQLGTAVVDVAILGGLARALSREGRMDWSVWRGEEWVNVGITGGVLVVRMVFLAMVGLGGSGKGKRD